MVMSLSTLHQKYYSSYTVDASTVVPSLLFTEVVNASSFDPVQITIQNTASSPTQSEL